MKYTKHHEPLSTAKAVAALFIFLIPVILFFKFWNNQTVFFDDPLAMRNYVLFTVVVSGFLIGLLYLTSQTTHKVKSHSKAKTATKGKKKKK